MSDYVIKKGDKEWDRLFSAWKETKKDAGWVLLGGRQYRVIRNDDDSVLFIPVQGNIDAMYNSTTQGVPE